MPPSAHGLVSRPSVRSKARAAWGLLAFLPFAVLTACGGGVVKFVSASSSQATGGVSSSSGEVASPGNEASTSSLATASPTDQVVTPLAIALPVMVQVGNVTLRLPRGWEHGSSGDSQGFGPTLHSYKGFAQGRFHVQVGFGGSIDELAPVYCSRTRNSRSPLKPASVDVSAQDLQRLGDVTAHHRIWTIHCATGDEHRQAWVLPQSRVAVYEYCPGPETPTILATMSVDPDHPRPATTQYRQLPMVPPNCNDADTTDITSGR